MKHPSQLILMTVANLLTAAGLILIHMNGGIESTILWSAVIYLFSMNSFVFWGKGWRA